jgi:hypothetical protein
MLDILLGIGAGVRTVAIWLYVSRSLLNAGRGPHVDRGDAGFQDDSPPGND